MQKTKKPPCGGKTGRDSVLDLGVDDRAGHIEGQEGVALLQGPGDEILPGAVAVHVEIQEEQEIRKS